MESFVLHERLTADTAPVADWALSRVLLMNDARYPWLILVPRRAGLVELHDLKHAERLVLMEEMARAGAGLKTLPGIAKINTGALGNLVPQLHIHVVARRVGDPAWPGPVWGHSPAVAYDEDALDGALLELRELF
ncbi:MAG TPA: HIT domain-containing protein [Rhizomicrobium sp.]|jgi:diadenosine tetraphosphate (Ap4A) HIT family hydrolase